MYYELFSSPFSSFLLAFSHVAEPVEQPHFRWSTASSSFPLPVSHLFSFSPFLSSFFPAVLFLIVLLLHAPLRQIARDDNQRIFTMFFRTMVRRGTRWNESLLTQHWLALALAISHHVLWRRSCVSGILRAHIAYTYTK